MTTTLTDAERAAMQQRAESAREWAMLPDDVRVLGRKQVDYIREGAADVMTLLALYEASQAALTGALAELTAARARIETLEYDLAAAQWLRSEAGQDE